MPVERESLSQGGFERGNNNQLRRLAVISLKRWPKVEDLRAKLNGRAKAKPEFRFYSLYDKVYRMDFLEAAYEQCRKNRGSPGVDEQTFEDIAKYGVQRYLAELAEELKELRYRPQPVKRVMIEKEGQPGKYRPLGIPTIKDRIVQQAVKLLLEPIFEADFTDNAYGYRAGKSAQDAVREVNDCLRTRYVDVVDADLSKYFDTIPHAELLHSVKRRIADSKILWLICHWLKVPVHETKENGKVVIGGGKKTKEGTPQGGVISPLLANIYFRRFLVAWKQRGLDRKYQSKIVNYADDFVILTRKHAQEAHAEARQILTGIGLTLNETKTRIIYAWKQPFNFLGYTFGKLYGWRGQEYLGPKPSDKSAQKYREKVRELTACDQTWRNPESVAVALNQTTQGFWNYFHLGRVNEICHALDAYLWERMRRWASSKYPRSRGRSKSCSGGRTARFKKLQAATKLLVWGRDILRKRQPRVTV
jgi:RNA-directed DNA polymerase